MFYYSYIKADGAELYTAICLPAEKEKYPTVIIRCPYVDNAENMTDDEACAHIYESHRSYTESGYAVVYQHCRGSGKSSGDFIPYINEREDTLALYDWIRAQDFYNGELYLVGGSYTSSVHFVATPFADDIKGAILEKQDCERYNCNYRNGFYKMGLHGRWYFKMYKKKSIPQKNFVPEVYNMLPLKDLSLTVTGERAADFDEKLRHPSRNDDFWKTRFGGGEAHDAIKYANIPILLVTGFYDIYTGGIFDMWNGLDEATKSKSALVVHAYDHGGSSNNQPVIFECGEVSDAFPNFKINWLDSIRGKCDAPFEQGRVTYYKLFGDEWCTDDFEAPKRSMIFKLGEGEKTYRYNPYAPASFKGGLSTNFGGTRFQDAPNSRYDILSFYTPEFKEDTFIKGKMSAKLRVRSNCEDTCFYMRISLAKNEGDYGLRDDINQISNFCEDYNPGDESDMTFNFDEHAFVVYKGEKLRIDVSSSAFPYYVRHTNNKGLFSEQITAKIADNTVILDESFLTITFE